MLCGFKNRVSVVKSQKDHWCFHSETAEGDFVRHSDAGSVETGQWCPFRHQLINCRLDGGYRGGLLEKILQIGLQMQWSVLIISIFFIKKIHSIHDFANRTSFALELDAAGMD